MTLRTHVNMTYKLSIFWVKGEDLDEEINKL
jgi:hypothetical protein